MQRSLGFVVLFLMIIACVSGAEAIDIYFAEVKNGGALNKGIRPSPILRLLGKAKALLRLIVMAALASWVLYQRVVLVR